MGRIALVVDGRVSRIDLLVRIPFEGENYQFCVTKMRIHATGSFLMLSKRNRQNILVKVTYSCAL
jgi:hypothetical protein